MTPQTTLVGTAPLWSVGWMSPLAVGHQEYKGLGPRPVPTAKQEIILCHETIKAMRDAGVAVHTIATKLGTSTHTVGRALHPGYGETGRSTPVTDHAYTVLAPHIKELLLAGKSIRGIARDFGVSAYAVRQVRDTATAQHTA
jgi:DNA invertase Pin-like site-specific DNA recombinase